MKTLVVMRHGKAMPYANNQQDMDRTLSDAGAKALNARLPQMLRLLETRGSAVQIWTSPAKRARQTAKILEKALQKQHVPLEKNVKVDNCLWEQDVDGFLADLHASDADFIFAVGHVPFVEDVVEALVGSTPHFSTGALGCLEVHLADDSALDTPYPQDNARLLWFVQGPVSAYWETLNQFQQTVIQTAEAIEDRREAFLADPKDIETIHRFRTNIRTLRSLIAFIRPWQDAEQNTETQAILKEIVGHTSRLRELDVFEKQARSNEGSSPDLLEFCKKEASAERARVLKYLSSKQATKTFEKAMDLAKNIVWKKCYTEFGLPQCVVRARFDAMIEKVREELATLRLSDEEQTHVVRKRAKRARYVSEFNEGILGADAVDIARGMMAHQDNLGDICDARANIRLINEFLQRDLPEPVIWELNLMRAQSETFLYTTLRASEVEQAG